MRTNTSGVRTPAYRWTILILLTLLAVAVLRGHLVTLIRALFWLAMMSFWLWLAACFVMGIASALRRTARCFVSARPPQRRRAAVHQAVLTQHGAGVARGPGVMSAGVQGTPGGEPADGQGEFLTIGALQAILDRVDPYTRTRFEPGERVIICGGRCARVYKIATCEALGYHCPVDGASLRPRLGAHGEGVRSASEACTTSLPAPPP